MSLQGETWLVVTFFIRCIKPLCGWCTVKLESKVHLFAKFMFAMSIWYDIFGGWGCRWLSQKICLCCFKVFVILFVRAKRHLTCLACGFMVYLESNEQSYLWVEDNLEWRGMNSIKSLSWQRFLAKKSGPLFYSSDCSLFL